uniref:LRRCT domain-containing protein n=1 Tax=Podarcis muralis TaxID=64176 RepID=A0A670JYZ7_PODMU
MEHKLRWVPEDLPANATTILLDYNRIATLQNRTFVVQGALRHLSLRSNILGVIHPQALAGLSELRELDLSGNYLIVLQPNTFLPVPRLRMLNLGNNKLLALEPELLRSLPHLESLFLQGNALVSLSPDLFSNLPSLHFLRLHNNPWGCTCAIQPLYQWLTDNAEKVPGEQDSTGKGLESSPDSVFPSSLPKRIHGVWWVKQGSWTQLAFIIAPSAPLEMTNHLFVHLGLYPTKFKADPFEQMNLS